MNRCTGHCCLDFSLNIDALTDPAQDIQDGDYIRDMVVLKYQIDDQTYACDCKHFDGQNCTDYENRPIMCQDYPYGRSCKRDGCTKKDSSSPTHSPDSLLSPHET